MLFEIITLFPDFFRPFFATSMLKKAISEGHIDYRIHNLRRFGKGKHRSVDDIPYGGATQASVLQPRGQDRQLERKSPKKMSSRGKGMLLRADVLVNAISVARQATDQLHVAMLSPRGKILTAARARQLSKKPNICFLCGHYEGVDARVEAVVDEQISIGDYITFSGEVATLVVIETIARLIDGVLGSPLSISEESFEDGLLEHDQFTRPAEIVGLKTVPSTLLSGNHREIAYWRRVNAIKQTYLNRPDLLANANLTDDERWVLAEFAEKNKI